MVGTRKRKEGKGVSTWGCMAVVKGLRVYAVTGGALAYGNGDENVRSRIIAYLSEAKSMDGVAEAAAAYEKAFYEARMNENGTADLSGREDAPLKITTFQYDAGKGGWCPDLFGRKAEYTYVKNMENFPIYVTRYIGRVPDPQEYSFRIEPGCVGVIGPSMALSTPVRQGVIHDMEWEKKEKPRYSVDPIDERIVRLDQKLDFLGYIDDNMPSPMTESVGAWYRGQYPDDDMPVTFAPFYVLVDALNAAKDDGSPYEALGISDSVVRERVFEELAKRLHVDYGDVYQKWLQPADHADLIIPDNFDDAFNARDLTEIEPNRNIRYIVEFGEDFMDDVEFTCPNHENAREELKREWRTFCLENGFNPAQEVHIRCAGEDMDRLMTEKGVTELMIVNAMEEAGYYLDEINGGPVFNTEAGTARFDSWTDVNDWLRGVVFDDPKIADRVAAALKLDDPSFGYGGDLGMTPVVEKPAVIDKLNELARLKEDVRESCQEAVKAVDETLSFGGFFQNDMSPTGWSMTAPDGYMVPLDMNYPYLGSVTGVVEMGLAKAKCAMEEAHETREQKKEPKQKLQTKAHRHDAGMER